MDGLEAAALILEMNTGVPIVAMTANVMSNDMDVYRKSGMRDCVGKPFTSQELWRCLLKYLTPVSRAASVSENTDDNPEFDSAFQKSLKKLFARNNLTKFEEINEALEKNDIKLAHRLAHSLKSNAAHIGMSSLQKVAGDIEMQLKNGKGPADSQLLALLKTEFDAAILQLLPLLNDEDSSIGELPPLEPKKALELLEELEVMLKNGNTECINLTGALRAIKGSGTLIRQIEDFDFDLAVATLAELKKQFYKGG